MNTKANRLTVLGASFLLCFVLGSARQCFLCYKVKPDNSCAHETRTCNPGNAEACYTRRHSIGEHIIKIERGCTFLCKTHVDRFHYFKAETLCCMKNLCNTHDIWPEN